MLRMYRMYVCMYVYIYMYVCYVCMCIYVCMYVSAKCMYHTSNLDTSINISKLTLQTNLHVNNIQFLTLSSNITDFRTRTQCWMLFIFWGIRRFGSWLLPSTRDWLLLYCKTVIIFKFDIRGNGWDPTLWIPADHSVASKQWLPSLCITDAVTGCPVVRTRGEVQRSHLDLADWSTTVTYLQTYA
jgi:hypothetical protein